MYLSTKGIAHVLLQVWVVMSWTHHPGAVVTFLLSRKCYNVYRCPYGTLPRKCYDVYRCPYGTLPVNACVPEKPHMVFVTQKGVSVFNFHPHHTIVPQRGCAHPQQPQWHTNLFLTCPERFLIVANLCIETPCVMDYFTSPVSHQEWDRECPWAKSTSILFLGMLWIGPLPIGLCAIGPFLTDVSELFTYEG